MIPAAQEQLKALCVSNILIESSIIDGDRRIQYYFPEKATGWFRWMLDVAVTITDYDTVALGIGNE